MAQPFIPVRSLGYDPNPREIAERVNQILKNFPQFGGADYRGISTPVANYSVIASDYTIFADASATATLQISLPPVASNCWRVLVVKKIDVGSNPVKVIPDSGDSSARIDGATSKSMTAQYDGLAVQCDGATWYIIPQG